MPYINLRTNIKIEDKNELQKTFGELVQKIPGKTPLRTMIHIDSEQDMFFAGTSDPCAMVETLVNTPTDLSNIQEYCNAVLDMLSTNYPIPESRIFVSVNELEHWFSRR